MSRNSSPGINFDCAKSSLSKIYSFVLKLLALYRYYEATNIGSRGEYAIIVMPIYLCTRALSLRDTMQVA